MDVFDMSNTLLMFILSIAGSIILMSFLVIGFFLKIIHSDVRKNTEENGRNKGRIELVELKSDSEIKKLTEVTQLEIRQLSSNVSNLTTSVQDLVKFYVNQK